MRRWVVTGPAGAGKSTFCACLERGGAAVLDGDRLGHEILGRDDIVSSLAKEFGSGVLENGAVDRGALGRIVFANPDALVILNRITHGPLSTLAAARFDVIENEGSHGLAVLEAAVYFLLPPVLGVELVITVTASDDTRLTRLREWSGLDLDQARSRIEAQRPLEAGWASADIVVVNEGSVKSLEGEAGAILARLED